MDYQIPYTNRPEDITKLFDLLPSQAVPAGALESGIIKKWGFSPVSARHLFEILQKLGFIDAQNRASAIWQQYAAGEKRGSCLASALKKAYPALFKGMLCPYLEDDYSLTDFFKRTFKATLKDTGLLLRTFQCLAEKADFQDLLCNEGNEVNAATAAQTMPETTMKVNPNLQLTIQIHIDPQTPDEKIEAIFKNMQKYLLNKKPQQ